MLPYNMARTELIAIVGTTASGKSELAVRLAKKLNGEIISADSRQVYRRLDIGTGKVNGSWQMARGKWPKRTFVYKKIPHYCINLVDPKKVFTAADFKKCAEGAILDITNRDKIPLLVGGTGFWIDSVVYDLSFPEVPPNWKLRKELEKKSTAQLLKILAKLDPRKVRNIDIHNRRRLERAIEIAKALGKVPIIKKKKPYKTLWIGINPTPQLWGRGLEKRVVEMIKKGILSETKWLMKNVKNKRFREFGFEYQEAKKFIDQEITKKELLENIVKRSKDYAKRQMTWFKRNPNIGWIKNDTSAIKIIKRFISAN